MKSMQCLAVSFVALALSGCSPIKVSVDYNPSATFGALHSYAWRTGAQPETGDPLLDSTLLDARVRAAVDRVLASKGYQTAAAGTTPNFLVGYHVAVRQKTAVQTTGQPMNMWYGYGAGGWGGWPETYVHEYEEGVLLIDVIDPTTMKLLWRGTGTGVVHPDASPEKREQRINQAVDQSLAEFPPR